MIMEKKNTTFSSLVEADDEASHYLSDDSNASELSDNASY